MQKNKNEYLSTLLICFILIFVSCNSQSNNANSINKEEGKKYIIDSISPYGKRIVRYGNDSIYAFFQNGNLSYIKYTVASSPINRVLFENGKKKYIEYNSEYSISSLIEEYFYENSDNIYSRSFFKDTMIVTDNNPIHCFRYDVYYYENGKINSEGYTGSFGGENVPIGLQKLYNEEGKLSGTINYIYPKQKSEDLLRHEMYSYVIEIEYFKNEKPKWEKIFQNYALYEMEDDEDKRPIGTWKCYDENGKLIRTEEYKNGKIVKTKEY